MFLFLISARMSTGNAAMLGLPMAHVQEFEPHRSQSDPRKSVCVISGTLCQTIYVIIYFN